MKEYLKQRINELAERKEMLWEKWQNATSDTQAKFYESQVEKILFGINELQRILVTLE